MKKNYFLLLVTMLIGVSSLAQLTAPFTEQFNTTSLPSTWNRSQTTGSGWVFNLNMGYAAAPILDHSGVAGSVHAWVDFSGTDVGAILQSDTIDITALTTPELNFYTNNNLGTNTLNPLNVIFVEAYNGTSWVSVDSLRQDNMGVWTEHFYNMTPYIFSGNKLLIRFRAEAGGSYVGGTGSDFFFDLAIDDIGVVEFVPCRPVTAINSRNITSSSATVGWTTATGLDTAWIVEYGAPGFTPGTGTTVQVSVDSADITGLSAATIYEYYVTGLCSGDTTIAVGPNTFITACTAGLSGTYTIDPTSPTAGTNFNSFGDFFATALNCGLDAATIVDVVSGSGPYTLSADIPSIPGASATNTLTMNGNGNVINHGGGAYFLALNGVKHLTINDFMFINQTPSTPKFGIMMRGGCDSITIKNNTINAGISYTSSASACIIATNSLTSAFSYADNANNITVDSNTLIGGYYGVRFNGISTTVRNTGNKVTNNTIEDAYQYGAYGYYQNDFLVHNNDISRPNRTSISTFYGTYAYYSSQVVISNNKIHNAGNTSYTCYPIYLGYSLNTLGNESYIVNNAIYDMNTKGTFYGVYLYSFSSTTGKTKNINIWHNTITKNTDGGTGTTRGISTNTTTTTYFDSLDITNNIVDIYGSGSGTKYTIYLPAISYVSGGYNDFHMGATAGTNNFAYFGANQANLAAWSTTSGLTGDIDNNPIIISPFYTPYSNLVDNLGTPLPLVPADIDGVARTATPDMGAVEFVPSGGDLAIIDGGLSRVSDCYGTMDTAWVDIKNLFGSTIDFTTTPLTVYFNVTGPVNTTVTTVVNTDSLNVDSTMMVFNTAIDMSVPGKYSITAHIDFALNNILPVNDSLISIDEVEVKPILAVTPTYDTLYSYTDSSKLSTQSPFYPAGAFFITEICHFAGAGTGSPAGGRPSWLIADDYMEITGVPGSDLAGITFEQWNSSSLMSSYTFPSGTILSPNGTAIIAIGQLGSSTPSPSNFYYHGTGTFTGLFSSCGPNGRILKDASGAIMDVVGYGSGWSTFPAAAGVTASDWSGTTGSTCSTWGMRLEGADVNSYTNWVLSATSSQDPNTINAGVTVPAPSSVTDLTWTDLTTSTVLDTTPEIYAKGFTANGTYPIEASYITPCGTYSDTAYITVLNQTFDTTVINQCDSFTMPLSAVVHKATGFYVDTVVSSGIPTYDSLFNVYDVNIDTTNAMFTLVECDSFISPSGKVWGTTGTYNDTIVNSLGCDSLMVFNLTVNYSSAGMITTTVCDTFIAPSGIALYSSGMYMDTIPNAIGCDSVISINLTVINSTTSSVSPVVCDSFTSPTGIVWTTTGVYNDTLTNSIGCDSVIVFNLTVNYSYSRTDVIALCAGIPHRVGPSLYTTAGTYTNVFSTSKGCDSTIITNLSYFAPANATMSYNFCTGDSVMVLGNWYYAATSFMDTIIGGSSHGCDSITTHNITTRTVSPALNLGSDVVACLDGGVTIFASSAYDTYNWSSGGTTNVLSNTGAMAGIGTTNHVLTVTQASSGCTATDDINITYNSCVGLSEVDADLNVNLYPNPATNFVTIEIFDKYNEGSLKLEILNSIGQVVTSKNITNSSEKVIMDVNNFSKGMYLVRISSDKLYMTKKLIIQK